MPKNSKSNAPLGAELTALSRRRLRENFSIRLANVVGFQFFGTNGLSALQPFPTKARNHRAVRILNPLHRNPRTSKQGPKPLSQCGIRRNHRLKLAFRKLSLTDDLFLAQQSFAVHPNQLGILRAGLIVPGIHIAASRIKQGENASTLRRAPCNRFEQRNRSDRFLQCLRQSLNRCQSYTQPRERTRAADDGKCSQIALAISVLSEERGDLRYQLRRKRAARERNDLDDRADLPFSALGRRDASLLTRSINRQQKLRH